VGDEGEVLVAAALHLDRLVFGEAFHRHADGVVERLVEHAPRQSRGGDAAFFRELVDAGAQDAIFRHHLLDVEAGLEALHAVRRRAAFHRVERLGAARLQGERDLADERRDMVVEGGRVERLRRRQLAHARSPFGQQRVALVDEEGRQTFQFSHESSTRE
jgi:hypothetical protein